VGDTEDVIHRIISSAVKKYDCMLEDSWLAVLLGNQLLSNELLRLKFKQISSRFITSINLQNLDSCARIMKYVELRHVDNILGYLGIKDFNEQFIYVATRLENVNGDALKPINTESDLILSSSQPFIQMQSFFFERVWNMAIPAIQRIAEIEREMSSHGEIANKITSDSSEIRNSMTDIIEKSLSEILVVFPHINTFSCAESAGIISLLGEKIKYNVLVRAIVHIDKNDDGEVEATKEKIRNSLRMKNNDLYASLVFLTKNLKDRNILLIVDQSSLLSIEVIDNRKEVLTEMIGSATFSNNETKVFASVSVFDTLWIQAELEKQSRTKQGFFKIFKGLELREEEYNRKWLFEEGKGGKHTRA
jgi:hypothetical protein